jgi:hypothetical protein
MSKLYRDRLPLSTKDGVYIQLHLRIQGHRLWSS